jgi:hypothetical protein
MIDAKDAAFTQSGNVLPRGVGGCHVRCDSVVKGRKLCRHQKSREIDYRGPKMPQFTTTTASIHNATFVYKCAACRLRTILEFFSDFFDNRASNAVAP